MSVLSWSHCTRWHLGTVHDHSIAISRRTRQLLHTVADVDQGWGKPDRQTVSEQLVEAVVEIVDSGQRRQWRIIEEQWAKEAVEHRSRQ